MTTKEISKQKKILMDAHLSFKKKLSMHAFFKLNNNEMSEDLVQDTFVKTWEYLMRGGKIETMKAFLYHVLNNLIIDQYRKHKTVSLDTLLEKGFEPGFTEEERIINIVDGKVAVSLIKNLPPTYKKVIHMRYVDDLSLEEISNATGQSKNTVAVQIHRGIEKLKSLYNPLLDKSMASSV